jgi:hypothetical protein
MFSFPVTRLNALTNSSVTRFSARAPIRCTVQINSSTKVLRVELRLQLQNGGYALLSIDATEPPPIINRAKAPRRRRL